MTKRIAICLILLSVAVSVSSGATFLFRNGLDVGGYIYGGTQDTFTGEAADAAYGNAHENIYVRAGGPQAAIECTTLIKFTDLGIFLPEDFVVQSARIGLTLYSGVPQGDITIRVSELLKQWDNTVLTWTEDGLGNEWSSGGALGVDANGIIPADRSDAVMDSVLIADGTSPYETYWWDVDPNLVQRWVRSDKSNYGVVFYCLQNEGGSAVFVGRAARGEWVNLVPLRPQLEITGFVATQCSEFLQNSAAGYAEDFNHDCFIDMEDLMSFVESWLACNDPHNPSCSN